MSNISENIIRIQSNQVGPFTATNNISDIRINGEQVVDMTRSYVELELRASYTHTGANAAVSINGTYNPVVKVNNNGISYDVQMVENCRLQSQNQGHLEEINRVDVLRTGLNNLTLSRDEQNSLNHLGVAQLRNNGNQRYGPFINAVSEGTINSSQVVPRAKIPLKQLFGLGEVSQLDLNKTGDLNIRLELNMPTVEFETSNFQGHLDATLANSTGQITVEDVVQATNNRTIQLKNKFENLHNLPFWVNQFVKIDGDTGTFAGGGQFQLIESISIEKSTGVVSLTFPVDILNAGQTLSNAVVVPEFGGVAVAVTIENVSLVYTNLQGATVTGQNSYFTYDTEQLTSVVSATQTQYSQIFSLPPNCINYMAMFPTNNNISNIGDTAVYTYRNRLDDKQETFRGVEIDSSFYYEQLRRTLINGGMRLKVLGDVVDSTAVYPASINAGLRQNYIMNAVDQTTNTKILQMNVTSNTAGSNITKINLYKQLVKIL